MPKLFPTHFQIILDEHERGSLDTLYDVEPYLRDEVAMLHEVIRAGIKALKPIAEEKRRDPLHRTRSQREVERKRSATHHATKVALKVERERSPVPAPHRHVEKYVGFPISEGLRQKFEDYLDEHESVSEEDALVFLLDQGLWRAKEVDEQFDQGEADGPRWGVQVFRELRHELGVDPSTNEDQSRSSEKVSKVAALAERLCRKWKTRGSNPLRG
jgi:hypothetical protein